MVSPTTQAHIDAIQRALTPEEDAAVRAYLASLPLAERSAWIASLRVLSVPEAVAMIRAQHGADRRGTASPNDAGATTDSPKLQTTATAHVSAGAAEPRPVDAAKSEPMGGPVVAAKPVGAAARAPVTAVTAELVGTAKPPAAGAAETPAHNVVAPISMTRPASTAVAVPHDVLTSPAPLPNTPAQTAPTVPAAASSAAAPSLEAAPSTAPRTVATDADTHLLAIEHALTAGERFLVHAMVARMSPDERERLLDKLLSASVAEGAAIFRVAIQELTTQAQPDATQTEPTPIAGDHAPDERQRLDDAETLDDAGELDDADLDDNEIGDAEELEIEELDEQPDGEPADSAKRVIDDRKPTEGATHGSATIPPAAVPSPDLPTLAPEAFPHFKAIESALTLAERLRVFELGAQLSPTQLRAWIAELSALPASQAVAKIRAALAAADGAGQPVKKGGVS